MAFLLDKKREHETECETAIRSRRWGQAAFHAAKAADFSYALAEQCDDVVARRYVEDAEGWLEIGEQLAAKPPDASAPGERRAVADDKSRASPADEDWLVTEKPDVTFGMIAGMEQAKRTINDLVLSPLQQPEKARALGLKPGGGVLLFGPPGTGKTMLGKAIACELEAPFYYASGAQVRSKWHGESEQRLSALIAAARRHSVAVLFFDEVEGLLPRRGGNSVVDNRIVTQFLADIGGFRDSENALLLLGATNHPWAIDDAVFRTGRFDEKIFIGLPDPAARLGIISMHVRDVACADDVEPEGLTDSMEGYTGSDIVAIVNAAKRTALRRSIDSDAEPLLRRADFDDALAAVPRSVNPKLMARYRKFREERL